MRLWVDDSEPPEAGFHDWAKSAHEAIAVLESEKVHYVSLAAEAGALDVLHWLQRNQRLWPIHGIAIHRATRLQKTTLEAMIGNRRRS